MLPLEMIFKGSVHCGDPVFWLCYSPVFAALEFEEPEAWAVSIGTAQQSEGIKEQNLKSENTYVCMYFSVYIFGLAM